MYLAWRQRIFHSTSPRREAALCVIAHMLFAIVKAAYATTIRFAYNRDMKFDIDIRWLTDTEEQGAAQSVPASEQLQRVDYPFSPELGAGYYEQLTLAEGMKVFKSVHRFGPEAAGRLLTVVEAASTFPETTFNATSIHGGTSIHRERIPPVELVLKPGIGYFRLSNSFDMTLQVDASSDSEIAGCAITVTALDDLLGAELAGALLAGLCLSSSPSTHLSAIPPHVTAPLRGAIATAFSGNLRQLYAQAKLLEYLCLLTHRVTEQPKPPHARRRSEAMRQLHDELLRLEGKVPTLAQLARRFGMSVKSLNDCFAAEYGRSIQNYITECRLREAHAALVESDVPIKSLAARLGYVHVGNFNTAFRRVFGYPPGSLRRGRAEARTLEAS